MSSAILQVFAVVAAVGVAAVAGVLVWLGTGPLGTLPLRKLWQDLRRPPKSSTYMQVVVTAEQMRVPVWAEADLASRGRDADEVLEREAS